jgi:SAM-dependent methyltransferase
MPVSGTEGYAGEAPKLVREYESIAFSQAHRAVLHLLPAAPLRVLDIGAGTGRDAAALAEMGHEVLAVEPTEALRDAAIRLHPSPRIEWLDDSLPALARVRARGGSFGLIMMTAVWMHLDAAQRAEAMPNVATLLAAGGTIMMSLRHGPMPPGRRMFEVSGAETIALAGSCGLQLVFEAETPSAMPGKPGVSWTRLVFSKPAAGR